MMSKTIALRKVTADKLKTINNRVYFENAPDDSKFPYIVYSNTSTDLGNYPRNDSILTIDIWDKPKDDDTTAIENLTDDIESLLDHVNNPTSSILPTFYLLSRKNILDEDKKIKRRQLNFQVQYYERKENYTNECR